MIQHWLDPISNETHQLIRNSNLCAHISVYHTAFPEITNGNLAIIGTDATADRIRQSFYTTLKWQFGDLKVVDLGNLKKNEEMFLQPVLQELIEGNIHPILLGTDHANQFVIHRVLLAKYKRITFANVSAYLPEIAIAPPVTCQPIAYQLHFLETERLHQLDTLFKHHLRLSAYRADNESAEVLLRNSAYVNFDLSSVKAAEAPGQQNASPNGLISEEWCQLHRFAGIGDGIQLTSISGFVPDNDRSEQTARLIAHGLWYFMDGYSSRIGDYPFSVNNLVEYVVDIPALEQYHVTFWKSTKSGRWWLNVQLHNAPNSQKRNLTPCTYSDYLQSCNNEIPERLYQAIDSLEM